MCIEILCFVACPLAEFFYFAIQIFYNICSQEDSAYDQLIHGIRYLDLRVAHDPGTEEKFWINHGAVRMRPLEAIVSGIQRFVNETGEVVFMDIHRFPSGFDSEEDHNELIEYMIGKLGDFLALRSVTNDVTFDQLWATGKTIIWGYANSSIQMKHDFLWPAVDHVSINFRQMYTI